MSHLWNYNICLIINLCLIIYWFFLLFIDIDKYKLLYFYEIYLSYDIFVNIIYDDYLVIYYTCKLNFMGKITTYYNHNQV
jgi:hypothetical protein